MERRVFVKSGALALVTMGLSPSFLRRTAFGMELFNAPKGKVLICLFQRGAADGLNVIVPHGEKAYYAMRPSIAIPQPLRNVDGSAIDGPAEDRGMVFQRYTLFPWLRVRENVEFGPKLKGLGKAERVDGIRVVWPDGTVEDFPGQAADRAIVLRKGASRR